MNRKDSLRKSVFVVVDVQNDFCPGGSLAISSGDQVVDVINRLAPEFGYVVATKDWHPRGHVSFASSHPGRRPFDVVPMSGIDQTLWPDHCVAGSPGAEFHPRLDVRPISCVLHKGRGVGLDSYSAFFENDKKTPTGLEHLLKGLGYSRVYLCGLATDVCVFHSAMDAVRLGFQVFVVEDASRGVDVPAGSVEKALRDMGSAGVGVVSSREIPR